MSELKLPLYEVGDWVFNLRQVRQVSPVYKCANTRRYVVQINDQVVYLSDYASGSDELPFKSEAIRQRNALIEAWSSLLTKGDTRPITDERRLDPQL